MDKDIKQLIERLERTEYDDLDACKAAKELRRLTRQLAGVESKTLQPVGVEPVAWMFQPPDKRMAPKFDTQEHGGKWKPLVYLETVARIQAEKAQLQDDIENMAAKALDYWVLLDEIKDAFSNSDGNISRGWLGQMIKRIGEVSDRAMLAAIPQPIKDN